MMQLMYIYECLDDLMLFAEACRSWQEVSDLRSYDAIESRIKPAYLAGRVTNEPTLVGV
jgi:hypothetical protein